MNKPTPAPSIRAPSAAVLAQLERHVIANAMDGPTFLWDRGAQVFVTAVVRAGVVVDWQLDPARTKEEADALTDRHLRAALMAAALIAGAVNPVHGVEIDRQIAEAVGRRIDH